MQTEPERRYEGPANEIRVSGKTNVFKAFERIEEAFKTFDKVILSGINTGISKVLLITEITKLKIGGLHQYNWIETLKVESKEEQSDAREESKRFLTRFKVELFKQKPSTPPEGFHQEPYSEEERKKLSEMTSQGDDDREEGGYQRGRGGRGRGRGRGRGYYNNNYEGRGRGGRGRGRGGYDRENRDDRDREYSGRGRGGERGERRGGERGYRGDRGSRGERGGYRGRGENRGGYNQRRDDRGYHRNEDRGYQRDDRDNQPRGNEQSTRGNEQSTRGNEQANRGNRVPGLGGKGQKMGA